MAWHPDTQAVRVLDTALLFTGELVLSSELHREKSLFGSPRSRGEDTGQMLTHEVPCCPHRAGHWEQRTLWAVVALGAGSVEKKVGISLWCGAGSASLTVVTS